MTKYAKLIKRKITVLFLVVFCLYFCFGCAKRNVTAERIYFDFFGTTVYVNISDTGSFFWQKQHTEKCFSDIENLLNKISSEFSKDLQGSVTHKFNELNSGESVEVTNDYEAVFNIAKDCYEKTEGAFNPSVSLLVDLWGFSKRHAEIEFVKSLPYDRDRNSDGSFDLPDNEYINAFLELNDFSKVSLENGFLTKNALEVSAYGNVYTQKIDLSGIVKGYASQKICEIINGYDFEHFYISIGTSSMYLSSNLGGVEFDLGITDPNNPSGKPIKSIKVKDKYVSTSGTYQNCYELSGKTYHHIIDAKLGRPADTDILSATIISTDGATADALSTAVIVMGKDKALSFLETSHEIGYVLICQDGIYERV